jgi:hypothetical protein
LRPFWRSQELRQRSITHILQGVIALIRRSSSVTTDPTAALAAAISALRACTRKNWAKEVKGIARGIGSYAIGNRSAMAKSAVNDFPAIRAALLRFKFERNGCNLRKELVSVECYDAGPQGETLVCQPVNLMRTRIIYWSNFYCC